MDTDQHSTSDEGLGHATVVADVIAQRAPVDATTRTYGGLP
jgi:hypothetical protein